LPYRQYWIRKLVRYARKINGKGFSLMIVLEQTGGEETILSVAQWLFSLDTSVALECFKKSSKAKEPFRSERLLREIKEKGGLKACLKYLEYLTLECKVNDRMIHTELACLYVQYINSSLNMHYSTGRSQEGGNFQKRLDVKQAEQDKIIFGKQCNT
jgi:hypothetical protein